MPHPRRLALPTLVLALLAVVAGPAASRPFADAAGRVVEVPDRAARVVATGPPAAVLLSTLAPDRMAGWVRTPSSAERPYLAPTTWALPATGRLTGRGAPPTSRRCRP